MDLSKIDLSLFRRADALPDLRISTPQQERIVTPVQKPTPASRSEYLKNTIKDEVGSAKAERSISGLRQLSVALKDLSERLKALQKDVLKVDLSMNEVLNKDYISAEKALSAAQEKLGAAAGLTPSERIQMKSSLRTVGEELSQINENLRKRNREFFGTESLKDKAPSPSGSRILDLSRKETISLRKDVESKIQDQLEKLKARKTDPEVARGVADTLPTNEVKNDDSETVRIKAKVRMEAITASFEKRPEEALNAQNNPQRSRIVDLLYKDRNLEGEFTELAQDKSTAESKV